MPPRNGYEVYTIAAAEGNIPLGGLIQFGVVKAIAVGTSATVEGDRGIAVGEGAVAAVDGVAIGSGATTAGHSNALALGPGAAAQSDWQTHLSTSVLRIATAEPGVTQTGIVLVNQAGVEYLVTVDGAGLLKATAL